MSGGSKQNRKAEKAVAKKRRKEEREIAKSLKKQKLSVDDATAEIENQTLGNQYDEIIDESTSEISEFVDVENTEEPKPNESNETEKDKWFRRLKQGLSKSRINIVGTISRASVLKKFDELFWDDMEEALIAADIGYEMSIEIASRAKTLITEKKPQTEEEVFEIFSSVVTDMLKRNTQELSFADSGPSVFLIVGVNGTGKTTSTGKLARLLRSQGKTVIIAAADTFRAAGIEQLLEWGKRADVHVVRHKIGSDSAAVIYDAIESAKARGTEIVIADTAGRLHTKQNLMEELAKVSRVASREAKVPETLLVVDATTGQNGLHQARVFNEACGITGVILTKLDGTAKGGIVLTIQHELGIPVKFIGVGESIEDFHPFSPEEFAKAIFSPESKSI